MLLLSQTKKYIFVELPEDKEITVEVESSDSISSVTTKIQDKEGIAIDQQSLYFNEQALSNSDILGLYEMKNNDKLFLKINAEAYQYLVSLFEVQEVSNSIAFFFNIKISE
ncbi:unnamed protein product [Dovyalis caffra]|uniref:Ubiquitin-like domain-containing protein n=1 Tax=Dovyalis caffra TaxID=77055 RepID=A0AAV1RYU2_9ROSI|nr:unnamed protein product [Dovyalis caffra]